MRNQHRALCQHNSKKNSRKYVKISKINKYIRVRYNLEIEIPDFLWRNIRDNRLGLRLPFTTGNGRGHVGQLGVWDSFNIFQFPKWQKTATLLTLVL